MFKKKIIIKQKNNSVLENSNLFTFFLATSNTYILMIKNHFKSSSFYLGNLLIPIMIVFSCGILFPIYYSFIWMLFISMSFSAFAAYGTLFFTIRKSTMMKNVDMTANESSTLYLATLLIMLSVTFITFVVIILTLISFDNFGFLSHQWFFNNSNNLEGIKSINWFNIWWDMIGYYWITQSILVFSMSFFIEQLVSTQKNFFIIVFIYMLGGLFFGGIFSPTMYIDSNGEVIILTQENLKDLSGLELQGIIPTYQQGGAMWFISQLWPHYGLNQLAFNSLESATVDGVGNLSSWHDIRIWEIINLNGILYYVFMPWLYIVFGILMGGILDRFKKE
ncbi:MAG: hypothetical protein HRS50_00465 [Mycoplasmataceae bacterium]|nr:hypothetical protein [Mycoplasmataceae bacterium]